MPAFSLPAPVKARLANALAACANAVALPDALALLYGLNGAPDSGLAADAALWPRLFAPSTMAAPSLESALSLSATADARLA